MKKNTLWQCGCVLMCWMVLAGALLAQQPSVTPGVPEIESYSRNDYRGGTQNWAIAQTDNGLMYFANNDGILEYDGTYWKLIPRMTNAVVRAMLVHEGRIYAGSTNEIGYFAKQGRDYVYTSITKAYNLRDIGEVWGIHAYDGKIVFQTEKMLCLFHEGSKVEMIHAGSRFPSSFLVNGMMLVHDEQQGLMELRGNKLQLVPGGQRITGDRIGAILPLSGQGMVIGTMLNGLYRWGMSDQIEKWNVPADDYLRRMNIFSGTVVDGDLIFGTIQSGVVVVDRLGRIRQVVNKAKGLKNNTVLSIFPDREKNIWAGLDNGIAKVAYHSPITFLNDFFDIGSGYAIARKDGKLYMGTNQGLYSVDESTFYDPLKEPGSFRRIDGTVGQVWTLFDDGSPDGLLCGHTQGAYAVRGGLARLITPPGILGVWTFRDVPGRRDLLMAGIYDGLVLFEKDASGQWRYRCRVDGFRESSRAIEWDVDGGLWMTHGQQGIYKLYFNSSYTAVVKIETVDHYKGMLNDKDMNLAMIDGQVVFVSPRGIYRLDPASHTFYEHPLAQYFTSDGHPLPTGMVQDVNGNIWFFGQRGVGQLRPRSDGGYQRVEQPFLPLRGRMVSAFETLLVWDRQNVLFGMVDGFAHYRVDDRGEDLHPFSTHIRSFRGATDSIAHFRHADQPWPEPYPKYPFADNAFEVSYAATWFGTGQVEYASFLTGFDKDWSPWDERQRRQFTRLREGEYTLMVKARNIQGVESEPVTLVFRVMPPWYRTLVAKGVYVLLLLLSVLAVWGMTRRIIEKSRQREMLRQAELYRQEQEKLRHEALLNEKEMIQLRSEKLHFENQLKEKELANSTMNIIQKNEFLIKLKEELASAVQARDTDGIIRKISQTLRRIDQDIDNDSQWQLFETHLEQVHEDFLERLKSRHPELVPRELKLCAYLRMGMSSKEIAALMNISSRAVENNRYKLRKKMGMDQGDNLLEYITKL